MSNHSWKKELLTVPNFLSLMRLLLIPIYVRFYTNATQASDYYLSAAVLCISYLTDFADGKIARHYNMISNVGKLLDPLADKLTQFALLYTLSRRHRILLPVMILFLIKETLQCALLMVFARKGLFLSGALFAGKLCTAVLFASLLVLVIFPQIPANVLRVLVISDILFLLSSLTGYLRAYFGDNQTLTDLGQ